MYANEYDAINKDLERTRKAVIVFGDSFVEGQGSIDERILIKYPHHIDDGNVIKFDIGEEEKKQIVKDFPDIQLELLGAQGDMRWELNFVYHERNRNFGAHLCNEHLNKEWTHINFGMRGNGNRASIMNLFLHPFLNLDVAKEFIIIYVPSGPERFDFSHRENPVGGSPGHYYFETMWPTAKTARDNLQEQFEKQTKGRPTDIEDRAYYRASLWESYGHYLYSERMIAQEQVLHWQVLNQWMRSRKIRKFLWTPAFDNRWSRKHFLRSGLAPSLVDSFPWDKKFSPGGYNSFVNLVEAQEGLKYNSFYNYMGKGSPEGWITACAHPSYKGHKRFAKTIYEELKDVL